MASRTPGMSASVVPILIKATDPGSKMYLDGILLPGKCILPCCLVHVLVTLGCLVPAGTSTAGVQTWTTAGLDLFDESGNPQLRNVARAITNYIKSKVDQFLHAAPIPSRLTNRDNTSLRFQSPEQTQQQKKTSIVPSTHARRSATRARASPKIAHQHTEKWCRGSTTQPARLSRVGAGFIGTPILLPCFVCLTRARRKKIQAARPNPVTYLEQLPDVTTETGSTCWLTTDDGQSRAMSSATSASAYDS